MPDITDTQNSRGNSSLHSSYVNSLIGPATNLHQSEIPYIPSSQSLSATLSGPMKQEQVQSPAVGLVSSACISGKSSPIGRQLQQLSITENKNSLSECFAQQQQTNNPQCEGQLITDSLFGGTPKCANGIFDGSTSLNNDEIRDATTSSNLTDMALSSNQTSNTIGYNIF